jgi:hypothetical protein
MTKMSDWSINARGKSARSLRRTISARTIKITYTYFLKDGFHILNSVFSLLEAIGKYNRKTDVIQSQGRRHEDIKRRLEAAESKRSIAEGLRVPE